MRHGRRHRTNGLATGLVAIAAPLFFAAPASAVTQTFEYAGAPQTFTVPSGVTHIQVDAYGAAGGGPGGGFSSGGLGGRATAEIGVTPGEVLQVNVGGAGGDGAPMTLIPGGFNGGGDADCSNSGSGGGGAGGGASDIRRDANGDGGYALSERLVVGGGGGGAGGAADSNGGSGGGTAGGAGGFSGQDTTPAGGGTQTTGGIGGTSFGGAFPGQPGQLGSGGDAGCRGAGGGGLYGGGAGSNNGGGGGGSGFTPSGAGMANGVQTGNGRIAITYSGVLPTLATRASADVVLGGSVTDTATLAGGANPTGQITFRLFGPGDESCAGDPVFTATRDVSGNGTYQSGEFAPADAGTYRWVATYSGDADNRQVSGDCQDPAERVTVAPPDPAVAVTGLERDREEGTATLTVAANRPGALRIEKTNKVRGFGPVRLDRAGEGELEVVAREKAAQKLRRTGRVTVNPRIKFAAAGLDYEVGVRHEFDLRLSTP